MPTQTHRSEGVARSSPDLPADFAEPKSTRLDGDRPRKPRADSPAQPRPASLGAASWSTQEWLRFLQACPKACQSDQHGPSSTRAFSLTARGNSEIAHQWLLLAIKTGYKPADARLEDYLVTIGRRKLVVPLYRALLASPDGRNRAREIYDKARPGYHPITVATLERLFRE